MADRMQTAAPPTARTPARTHVRAWIAGGLALALAACAGTPPPAPAPPLQVKAVKTAASLPGPRYTWVAMPQLLAAESDARVMDPQLRARLQSALDDALQAKGYRPADDPARADIITAFRVGVRDVEQTTVERSGAAMPVPQAAIECTLGGGCSQLVTRADDGAPTMRLSTTDYTEGGLLVEVLEPGTIRLLWSALASGTVHEGDGTQQRLDEIAAKTLAGLPAAGG